VSDSAVSPREGTARSAGTIEREPLTNVRRPRGPWSTSNTIVGCFARTTGRGPTIDPDLAVEVFVLEPLRAAAH
jgi:hypothetical protein